MIYTCFYLPEQAASNLHSSVYQDFGLEPEVNPLITLNCPELESSANRLQLVEYACCLWHWRNPGRHLASWFGLTSHRQREKTSTFFETAEPLEKAVCDQHIATWGLCRMMDQNRQLISLHTQAEACHPGLGGFIRDVLDHFEIAIPPAWFENNSGVYANYWAMHNDDFIDYMEFSWPLVAYALSLVGSHPYTLNKVRYKTVSEDKAIGYFVERLFIIWYLLRDKEVVNLGREIRIMNKVNNRGRD